MEIITRSHIDEEHAAGPNFPIAESADGRFSWNSGADGYVSISCAASGLSDNTFGKVGCHSVYLQYGASDPEVTPELLAEARAFSQSVDAERARRRRPQPKPLEATPLPQHVQRLIAQYRTSERAWDAEDESAWAILQQYGY